jgi:glycerol transport system ATP-binding protein
MARIELDELAHSYMANPKGPDDYALKRIHTTWDDGGAYALLGPSGCGKTTMLNIISGLLVPSHGKVLYDGKDVTKLPPEQRNIAQVFQFPVLYDTMTVYENLAFPLKNRKIPKDQVNKRVHEIADSLDLTADLNKRAAGLSADAKQKISLGRGLVRSDVAAILFDEPLTVIDPHLKWQLRRKLKEIHKRFEHTLIYVTHDQVEAMTFADKIVVMYEGELVQIGTPEELFEHPEHTFVGYFIGSPGMNLVECSVADGVAKAAGLEIPVPGIGTRRAAEASGTSKVELGIRPMYIDIRGKDAEGLEARITNVEDQGSAKIVTLALGDATFKARVSEDQELPADHCKVFLPPEKIKIFIDGRLAK